MKKNQFYGVLAVLSILLISQYQCLAQKKPTPILSIKQKIAIDGDPSDWPVPAMVFLESQDGKAQMRLASSFSTFYAFVEVEDKSPMKNGADRPEEMFKGGDTIAFYFKIDKGPAQRVAACWRNGKPEVYVYREKFGKKKPYVFRSPVGEAKFDYVAPAEKAQVAFKRYEGKGYTMEIALPWRHTLGNWPHQPKSSFRFDAQVVFSDPGGTQNAGAAWLVATDGPGLTIEDLPTEAKLYPDSWGDTKFVTDVAVNSDKPALTIAQPPGGATVELDLPRPGRLTVNITDENGWIIRELVMAKKYKAGKHRIHWDGRDRYGEPLPPGNYKWKALLFDGMKTEFMGSVGNSGRPPYRTPDGLGSMGGQHGSMKSVAQDDGGVYMSNARQEGPPVMRKIDPVSGKALWMRSAGSFKGVEGIAAAEGLACFINDLGRRSGNKRDLVRIDPSSGRDVKMESGKSRIPLDDLDKDSQIGGIAIVDGKAWISITNKKLIISIDLKTGKKGRLLNVPSPQGLAKLSSGKLLVCSGSEILVVDTATGATTPLVSNLEAPRDVCLDRQGNIYVSQLGTSQQVKKFSPDGKRALATWGKQGGKTNQQIPYDPMAFRNITDLTVGPKGNIWLAESDGLVRRFIKLDANGKWLEDFYGPVAYNAFGPDLDDFSNVYYTISGGRYIQTKLNYEQYKKNPMDPAKGWHVTAIHDMGLAADGKTVNETMRTIAKTGYGHVIVFRGKNGQRYFLRISELNRATSPIGAGLWIEKNGRWMPCAMIIKDSKKGKSWADKNGDGLIQPDEEYEGLPVNRVAWIDRNLTLHGFKGTLAPASISKDGVPNYAGGTFKPYLKDGEESYFGSNWTFVSPGENGTAYFISNVGQHRHLSFWDRATENRLIKVKDGKAQWVVGQHHARPRFVELSTNSGVAGVQNGVVLVRNIEPCNYVAFTEDGFVLGDIMVDENGKHPKVGPYVINIESFTGLYLKDPKTGKNILFTVSSGDDRILEVSGPGKMTRLQGDIKLDEVSPDIQPSFKIPYSTWYGNTSRGMGVNGDDAEWRPDVRSYSVCHSKQVVGDFKLRRDAGSLHLYATVLDRKMADGDSLKLILANGRGGERYELDLTIKWATKEYRKKKVQYWAAIPNLVHNDKDVKDAKIETAVKTRWRNLGYRVECEIPLELMKSIAKKREQSFRREIKAKKSIGTITEVRPDLKDPIYIGFQIKGADYNARYPSNGKLVKAVLD